MLSQEGLQRMFVSGLSEHCLKLLDVTCIESVPIDSVLGEFRRWIVEGLSLDSREPFWADHPGHAISAGVGPPRAPAIGYRSPSFDPRPICNSGAETQTERGHSAAGTARKRPTAPFQAPAIPLTREGLLPIMVRNRKALFSQPLRHRPEDLVPGLHARVLPYLVNALPVLVGADDVPQRCAFVVYLHFHADWGVCGHCVGSIGGTSVLVPALPLPRLPAAVRERITCRRPVLINDNYFCRAATVVDAEQCRQSLFSPGERVHS